VGFRDLRMKSGKERAGHVRPKHISSQREECDASDPSCGWYVVGGGVGCTILRASAMRLSPTPVLRAKLEGQDYAPVDPRRGWY
jgi:hypothetical protein